MQAQWSSGVKRHHPAKTNCLPSSTRGTAARAAVLDEAIRLIQSDKVEKLTGQHIHRIASMRDRDRRRMFLRQAFSSGKEVAACLAFAMEIGWREALDDMLRFRVTVLGPDAARPRGPSASRRTTPPPARHYRPASLDEKKGTHRRAR